MTPAHSRPLGRYDHLYDAVAVVALLLMTTVALLTWRDFGITWDESVHLNYGDHLLAFFTSKFEDQAALTYRLDYLYGGSFDLSGTIFREIAKPLGRFDAIHLFGTLIGVIGLWGTWKLGRVLGGPRAGMLAALFIGATSVYWGHMPNNPKDLPFAAAYVWAMGFMIQAIRSFPRVPRSLAIKLAIAIGLAMSVRIAGLLLVCYLGAAIGAWLLYHGLMNRYMRRDLETTYRHAQRLAFTAIGVTAGAWLVMVIGWPWALLDPIKRPLAALRFMSQFMSHQREMPFAGEMISTYDVDWRYMPHYFGLKLPEFVVVLSVLGLAVGVWRLVRRAREFRYFTENLVLGTLIFAILFPWGYAVYKESVVYDGLRHFLFEVPVVVGAAAWLANGIITRVSQRLDVTGAVLSAVVVTGLCVDQYTKMIHLHPHEYVYFNRFIGGVGGALGKYDTDYYAETHREAIEQLARRLWKQNPDEYLNTRYRVASCVGRFITTYKAPPNIVYRRRDSAPYDFWIGYTRENCARRHRSDPIVLEVRRDGAMLTIVRDRRTSKRKRSSRPKHPPRRRTRDDHTRP